MLKLPKFTKGKWVDCGDCTVGVEDDDGTIKCWICECVPDYVHIDEIQAQANARLIASAPEMYRLLKSVVDGSAFLVDYNGHRIFMEDTARVFKNLIRYIEDGDI